MKKNDAMKKNNDLLFDKYVAHRLDSTKAVLEVGAGASRSYMQNAVGTRRDSGIRSMCSRTLH